jgi:Cu-Zn family superoxide dismutase
MPAGDVVGVGIAEVTDTQGATLGDVRVEQTASGQVLVSIALDGLPEGPHAMHIHETGDCSAEDFTSAGGHLAGGAEHGVMVEGGPHPGDLPNISVAASGAATADVFKSDLTLDLMDDDDGAAFVVHAGSDDYESQPAGDAGDRIACGTFEFRTE